MMKQSLNFVTALSCEARALIDHYSLKKVSDKPFPLFHSELANQDTQVNLVVCGVGLMNAATAVGWLGARTQAMQCCWLNVGSAGHAVLDIGQAHLVHCSSQEGALRSHYPPLVATWPQGTVSLLSCVAPCSDYPDQQAVDMEASAFFQAAAKFSDTEVIQSIKVISDNREQGIEHLNADVIAELMQGSTALITQYAEALLALNTSVAWDSQAAMKALQHLRSSVSQRQQYSDLVSKHCALGLMDKIEQSIMHANSINQVLQQLEDNLRANPPKAVR